MDIAKLVQALEEFIFEVACMAILLPKTLFRLALFPGRAYRYVAEELQKKPEDRFDRFASPLILWSVTGVLPHFLVLSIFAANPVTRKVLASNPDDLLLKMFALAPETRFSALSAFAISLPLAFAAVISREKTHQTAKSSLREPLYTYCYCTAPIFLTASPMWFFWEAQERGVHPEFTFFLPAYVAVITLWTAWVGMSLSRLHLGVGWGRAVVLLGKAYLAFLGAMLLLEITIIMILGTLTLSPHA